MSAPNAKAVHGSSDAHILLAVASYLLEPKKIQRGSRVINKATGPTMAAKLALEKKAATKKAKPAVANEKNRMNRNKYNLEEYCITPQSVNVTKIAIITDDSDAVITHDSHWPNGRTPRIDNVSYTCEATEWN